MINDFRNKKVLHNYRLKHQMDEEIRFKYLYLKKIIEEIITDNDLSVETSDKLFTSLNKVYEKSLAIGYLETIMNNIYNKYNNTLNNIHLYRN